MPSPSTSSFSPNGTLLAAALGFVLVLLDVSVVNVALQALRKAFGTDVAGLLWVVNGYTVVFAALLLTSGTLGDRFGARRIYLLGFLVFTMGSLACGLAPSLPLLIAARLVQGLGAALLVPNSLAMLHRAFVEGEQRNRAVGWWGACGGISLAAGPVIGGLLVTQIGWRSIFLINLPIGLIGVFLTLRYVPPRNGSSQRKLDWGGQASAIVALAALSMALTEAGRLGWTHRLVVVGLLAAAIATLSFVWIEMRSRSPMVPLSLFRLPTFAAASVAGVVVNFAYYGLIFVFSLFFQIQQHRSAQLTGLAFLPMTLVLMLANVLAGRIVSRLGARLLMVVGLLLAALGYMLLLPVTLDGNYAVLVLPMMLAASGIALTVPTMTNAILLAVDGSRAGVAAGVLNTARQVGGLLGVAVLGSLIANTEPHAFMHGMRLSLGLCGVLLLSTSVLCWRRLRPSPITPHAPAHPKA